MSSRRLPGSSWLAARSRGSLKAIAGGGRPPGCLRTSSSATPSRLVSARELAPTTSASSQELALLAAVEAEAGACPLSAAAWQRLCAMVDSGAALLDQRLRPPRQGDGDERARPAARPSRAQPLAVAAGPGGRALRPARLVAQRTGRRAGSPIISAMAGSAREVAGRPERRPWRFADAGITLLRTTSRQAPEIWCRCDGGPHGYLSIAAHAHADALSVEVRYGGVDVLADPGTYCYHGEPAWRSYFRSTIAHNTVELDGRSQSDEGRSIPVDTSRGGHGNSASETSVTPAEWTAEHDGYLALRPRARHRRTVWLDRISRSLDIVDEIGGDRHDVRLIFHLGPEVEAEMDGESALLRWPGASTPGAARLGLPPRYGGACTEARRPRPRLVLPRPRAPRPGRPRSSAAGARRQNEPFITRQEFLDSTSDDRTPVYVRGHIMVRI